MTSLLDAAHRSGSRAHGTSLGRHRQRDRALAHHRSSTVRTGTFCAYVPVPDDPPIWQL